MDNRFESIYLEKGMYNHAGSTFTGVLESLDPSENYVGTALEGLDAYQRQLKRYGIRVKGAGASTVEKFFENSQTAVLFPEFVSRAVMAGIESDATLPAVVAATSETDGVDFRALTMPAGTVAAVTESTEMTEANFAFGETASPLSRYGLTVTASYETLRAQKLDALAILLAGVGKSLAHAYLNDAVDALKNDATTYTIGDEHIGGTKGTLDYAALIAFWNQFDTCELNTMLCSRDVAATLLQMPEFRDAAAGLDFQGTGKLITPLGATLIPCSALEKGEIIGIDRTRALEMVTSPAICVETDRLISRRLDRIVVSGAAGFAKLCTDASKILKVGA